MSKSIKIRIAAVVISILFEIITFWCGLHDNINASAISFMAHSFILISSVATTIVSVSKHKDFNDIISQLKAGIKTTSIYAVFMSCFFFSYNKWINPNYMENRRNHLIELTKDELLLEDIIVAAAKLSSILFIVTVFVLVEPSLVLKINLKFIPASSFLVANLGRLITTLSAL